MNKRKIFLLSAIAILALVYILQLVFSNRTQIKDFNLEGNPDQIVITRGINGEKTVLSKTEGKWLINESKYPADANAVENILNDMKSIRVLDTVSKNGDDERYGLNDNNALFVTLSEKGKELRTVKIGKSAATGQQSYITLDNDKAIKLVSGNLLSNASVSVDDLRDKNVYALNVSDIMKISVTTKDINYEIAKVGEPSVWTLVSQNGKSIQDGKLNIEKVNSWVAGLTNLRVQSFASENTKLPSYSLVNMTMTVQNREINVAVYESDEEGKYLILCSEIPYAFFVSSYTGEKFIKALKDLQ
ncbi:MAG: DUF4340 domain-containing protein [Treponema sp.]|nr:DUF4340 domain-containing protein [Treponema sp.]